MTHLNGTVHEALTVKAQRPLKAVLVGLLAGAIAIVAPIPATSQESNEDRCLGVINKGRAETRTVASEDEFFRHRDNFCREYNSSRETGRTASYGGSYKFLSFSASSSRMSAEAVATRYCRDTSGERRREADYMNYTSQVPKEAFEAYRACLRSANTDGVFVDHDGFLLLHNELLIGVRFKSGSAGEVAQMRVTSTAGVTCLWKHLGEGVQGNGDVIVMRNSTQANLHCTRERWDAESGVTIDRANGSARMAFRWLPYDTDLNPVDRLSEMQERIEETQAEVTSLRENGVVPAGTIAAFYSEQCPAHWSPANGNMNRPNLDGRFLVGSGPSTQDGNLQFAVGQMGGAHQMRVAVRNNQFKCCADDQGIMGVSVEWRDEGNSSVSGGGDQHSWRRSGWINHFPPYFAVKYCVKALVSQRLRGLVL